MAQRELQPENQGRLIGRVLIVAGAWAVGWIGWALFAAIQAGTGFSLNLGMIALGLLPLGLALVWAELAIRQRKLQAAVDHQSGQIANLKDRIKELEFTENRPQPDDALVQRIEQIASAQQKADETLAVFMSSRSAAPDRADQPLRLENALPPDNEPMLLPQSAVSPSQPLSHEDFIRAANFPHTPEDRVGFAVMKLASQSDQVKPFINAAQDILTLLSQDGVYMDDLRPEPARAEIWRNFAKGLRGRDIAALGGIRDRKVIETVATRMREDSVFRDAVHHFLRKFDFAFTAFGETATEEELLLFAETRSARAFMLLGRIAGTFE
ncbi:MAG: hypothetical protein QGI08_09690 [Paracoccaceae bacterium]|nr:hypothetical protein [Paracoccaceae bacterium]MDP7185979.1 hypothetical protein [Paracoccaceae bacterium]